MLVGALFDGSHCAVGWQPTAPVQGGAAVPDDISDVNPPDLKQVWVDWSPPMVGDPRGLPPSKSEESLDFPPEVPAYVIAPGTITDAVAMPMLRDTQNLVDSYTSLKDYVNSTKSWIFNMWDANVATSNEGTGGHHGSGFVHPHQEQHPDWATGWTAIVDNALLSTADAIVIAGQYVDLLNNAGQLYTRTDKDSVLPDLPVDEA